MIHLKRSALAASSLAVPIVLLAGLLQACTTQSGTAVEDEGTQQAAVENAQGVKQLPNGALMGHEFGPEKALRDALSTAKLSADQQKTIDTALQGAFPGKEAGRAAIQPFFTTLASQVRSGSIDEAALTSQLDALQKGGTDHRAAMVTAMQTVHDTLNADQRAAVASSIQARMATFGGEHGRDGGHEKRGEGKHMGLGRLGFILHGIDIPDAQLQKIKGALEEAGFNGKEHEAMEGKHEEMASQMSAALEAFKSDKFDASTALPNRAEEGPEHLTKLVKAMTVVVPLLDETQRAALATNLETGPRGFKMEHPAAAAPPSE